MPLKTNRIHSVDALRGFALAGIVIVHVVEQYMASQPTAEMTAIIQKGTIDKIIEQFLFWIFRGKFFALFSLLFGISFFIQMDNAAKKGISFKLRFLWRLVILFAIGLVHRFFYAGDILTIYAFLGIILIPFYHANSKVVFAFMALLFLGLGRFISFAIWGTEPIFLFPDGGKFYQNYIEALSNSSFIQILKLNWLRMPDDFNFQFNAFSGRGYLTFAFFLLGMLLGRTFWLENIANHTKRLKKIVIISFFGTIFFIPVFWYLFSQMDNIFDFTTWWSMFALTAYDNFNLFFTILLASGFILLFSNQRLQPILNLFSPYGRMALTNYVTQSMIGSFIFFNWGLGNVGKLRNIETLCIAILILAIQLIISHYWLKKFKFGPLEWLWRSLTYLKIQPISIITEDKILVPEK